MHYMHTLSSGQHVDMHVSRSCLEQLAGDESRNVHLMEKIVTPNTLQIVEMLVFFAGVVPFWLS